MKYTFISIITIILLLNPITYAIPSDTNSNPDAGILPGDFLYIFDILFEKITYMFTFNIEKKINYLNSFANERQQELNSLDTESKKRYSESIQKKQNELQTKITELKNKNMLYDDINQSTENTPTQQNETNINNIPQEIITNENITDQTNIEINQTEEQTTIITNKKLTEIEQYMCQSADEGNTCPKLLDLGFVTPVECCEILQLCC